MHKRASARDRLSHFVPLESSDLELDCAEPIQMVTHPTKLVALTEPGSIAAEKFRALAIRLKSFQKRQGLKTLLITSSIKGEGKSVVSANLAVTLAQSQRTLLIDCDLHQSGLRDVLGTPAQSGIAECWKESAPVSRFLRKMQGLPFWYLPSGRTSEVPVHILQSNRFSEMLQEFSRWFDWIVIDSPPLLPVADSAALAAHVDGTLLVVRQATTLRPLLKEALKTEHLKLLGIVANEWQGVERCYYSQHYYSNNMPYRETSRRDNPQLSTSLDTES